MNITQSNDFKIDIKETIYKLLDTGTYKSVDEYTIKMIASKYLWDRYKATSTHLQYAEVIKYLVDNLDYIVKGYLTDKGVEHLQGYEEQTIIDMVIIGKILKKEEYVNAYSRSVLSLSLELGIKPDFILMTYLNHYFDFVDSKEQVECIKQGFILDYYLYGTINKDIQTLYKLTDAQVNSVINGLASKTNNKRLEKMIEIINNIKVDNLVRVDNTYNAKQLSLDI